MQPAIYFHPPWSLVSSAVFQKKHGWEPLIYTVHALWGKNPGSPTEGWGQIMSHRGEKTWRTPLPAVKNQAFISSPQRHMCKYSRHWQAGYKPLSWTNYWHGLIFKQVIFSLSVGGWPGAGTLLPLLPLNLTKGTNPQNYSVDLANVLKTQTNAMELQSVLRSSKCP